MAKLTVKDLDEDAPVSQRKPIPGRYSLQVDRQAKASFGTSDEAEVVGMTIKKNYPVVQVMVYDTVLHTRKLIEAE